MAAAGLIADRYELRDRLGTGGMSTVRLAFDARLEREVAVKLLAEHLADDENFVSRFRREALSAARLVHPNIVQVFDFGLDERTGQHYIVMEFVAGHSCAEILRESGTLPVSDAIAIVVQACRGLEHAHRNGVVHRDVKPGNLLRSHEGVVKLADFGIAKATEQSSITQIGSVLGTAAYLAPEQARGEEAGPPADLYALGVVTYQMLAGRLPYEATSLTELAFKQQREVPPLIDQVNPEVPAALAHAVARALSLDAAARYDNALSMAEALRAGARGIEPPAADVADAATAATRVVEPGEEAPTDATRALPPREPPAPRGRRAPRRATAEEPARPARPQKRRGRGFARALWRVVLVLLVLAAVAVGVVIASDELGGNPQLRKVTAKDVNGAVQEIKQLIDDNTK
jgi:eukaryotic-like serine/threonine-protein kinase